MENFDFTQLWLEVEKILADDAEAAELAGDEAEAEERRKLANIILKVRVHHQGDANLMARLGRAN
jgi:hypothetical protein